MSLGTTAANGNTCEIAKSKVSINSCEISKSKERISHFNF